MKKLILFTFLILFGCESTRPLYEGYGLYDKKLVQSNINYVYEDAIFKIDRYTFRFKLKEFNNELAKITSPNAEVIQIDGTKTINEHMNESNVFEIDEALDNLFSQEKFYAEKNNLEFKYFEFTQWTPQSQGETFSTWKANGKEIRRRKIGIVD